MKNNRKTKKTQKTKKIQQLRGALRRGWEGQGCVVIGRHHNGITEKPRGIKKKTEKPEEVFQNQRKTIGKPKKPKKPQKIQQLRTLPPPSPYARPLVVAGIFGFC